MDKIEITLDIIRRCFYVYGKIWKESGHIVTAACVGTYDGHAHWDYIVMKDKNQDLVAPHTDCYSWTDEMWDEALEILDTAVFDEGKREGGVGQSIEE